MFKENEPLISDEFLKKLTVEINLLYGGPDFEEVNHMEESDSK
ncbi:bacitracin ABC transporter ATP-binding protein [Bacillus sp. JJ1609]